MPVEEFPSFSSSEMSTKFQLMVEDVIHQIDTTRFAISNEETRFYLNGVENYFPSYLELYTGVNLIVTGVDAAINSLGRNAVVEYLKL